MSTAITSAAQYKSVASQPCLVVVKCGAQWCGPCVKSAPAYEQLAFSYPGVKFYTLDIDVVPDYNDAAAVKALPTFLLMKNGEPLGLIQGADLKTVEHYVIAEQ